MKVLNVIRMLALTFFLAFMSFQVSYAAKPASKCLRETLMGSVRYPDAIMKQSGVGSVEVTFIISDEGKILIKNIKTDNEELAEYVKDQLGCISCENLFGAYNQHYRITFRFKLT
ncbi:MAG: hypothetical protein Q8867_04775 [Bacteroidota bacterium]|nr:hypothetical protein [Bacteroidota bacterium]